jgi:hypothetical protein
MRDLEERLAVRQLQSLLRVQSLKRKCKFAPNLNFNVSNGNVSLLKMHTKSQTEMLSLIIKSNFSILNSVLIAAEELTLSCSLKI